MKKFGSGSIYHIAYEVSSLVQQEKIIKNNGGIVVAKSNNGWNGMDVIFAIYNKNHSQLIEYVKLNNK